jgi:hypothetical protein
VIREGADRRVVHGRIAGVRDQTEAFAVLEHEPVGMCGADFGSLMSKEYGDYGRVIREANIKAE